MPTSEEVLGPRPNFARDLGAERAESEAESLAPLTRKAAAQSLGVLSRVALRMPSALERDEATLGEPVNPNRGVSFADYWNYHATGRGEEYLIKTFGAENVAKSVTGEHLVRQPKEDGTGMEWTRMVSSSDNPLYMASRLPNFLPELIGGIAGAALTPGGKVRGASLLAKSIGAAIGGEALGGLAEAAREKAVFGDVNAADIAKQRAINVPVDVFLDLFTVGLAKGVGKGISPFTHRGPAQFDMENAVKEVNRELERRGIPDRWNPTIGEATGNPELMGIEQFSAAMPGSQSVFRAVKEQQDEVIRKLQKIALGQDPMAQMATVPPMEEVGAGVIDALRNNTRPFIDAVEAAQRDAAHSVGSAAAGMADAATGGVRVVDTTIAGKQLRETAMAMRNDWKANSGYEQFFSDGRAVAPTRDLDTLASKFEEIKKETPTFVDPNTGTERQFSSVSRNRAHRLMDEVIRNRSGRISLEKLKQLRTDVDSLIEAGQATPDSGTRYLKMIRSAITKEMDDAVSSWGDQAAKQRWDLINKSYAEQTERFQQTGIAELFAEKIQGGRFVPDSEIAERAIRDKSTYSTYRDFFGPNSDAMNILRRSVAGKVIDDSASRTAGDVVDAAKFSENLSALWKSNPELASEAFGAESKDLARLSAQIGKLKGNPNVSLYDIRDLMVKGGATVDSIRNLVSKQADLDKQFANELLRTTAAGNVPTARPHAIVDSLLHNDALSNADVAKVMDVISQDAVLLGKVRALAVMDIFQRSAKAGKASDTPEVLRGQLPELQVDQLVQELGLSGKQAKGDVPHARDRVMSVIGSDSYGRLVQMAQLLTPRQAAREISNIGGAMAAGSERSKINRPGIAKKVEYQLNKAHAWVLAKIYTTPGVSKYAANNLMTPERKAALVNATIASGPFLRETIETWGPEWAQEMIWETKAQTDKIVEYLKGADSLESQAQAGHAIRGLTEGETEKILGPKPVFLP